MDNWIKRKIGLAGDEELTRDAIEAYQLRKLKETVGWAKENSRFYRQLLQGIEPSDLTCLKDIEKVSYTTVSDLREHGQEMICVSPSEISRIVTLDTSGTTGNPKRVYYTEEDQELTIDFFHNGMQNLTDKTDVVLILLPWERPGSVGDLLRQGLERFGAKPVPYGLLQRDYRDVPEVIDLMFSRGVTSIVGSPTQVYELAKSAQAFTTHPVWQHKVRDISRQMRSVLLSTEYVPDSACELIHRAWGCQVFEHYGMTETGLGGAVSCYVLEGYHPREADLYYEIIDPKNGRVLPDGEFGEVVFTTLTRRGMPFIRYRTGDISRWLPEACPCGSVLKRLDKVGARPETKAFYRV